MKKLISVLTIVLFSTVALAEDSFPAGRVTATGDEPNGNNQPVQEVNQSGVTVLGAGQQQAKTCIGCMTSGKDRMPLTSRIARPGIQQSSNTSSESPAGPVDVGN